MKKHLFVVASVVLFGCTHTNEEYENQIQQLRNAIESLDSENNELEYRITELEGRVDELESELENSKPQYHCFNE